MIGPWGAKACLLSLCSFQLDTSLRTGVRQKINRGKSAVIPARPMSDGERASCLAVWGSDIRASLRERVLGVYIGICMHRSMTSIYNGVNKFDMSLSVFGRV